MGYDTRDSASSTNVIVIVAGLIFVLLAGILLVGAGAYFVLRTSRAHEYAARAQATAARRAQEAIVKAKVASRAAEARVSTRREANRGSMPGLGGQIVIRLDQTGAAIMDDDPGDLTTLSTRLRAAVAKQTQMPTIDLRVNADCRFQHLDAIVNCCQQLGITQFCLHVLDPVTSGASSDGKEVREPVIVIQ